MAKQQKYPDFSAILPDLLYLPLWQVWNGTDISLMQVRMTLSYIVKFFSLKMTLCEYNIGKCPNLNRNTF